MKYLVILIIGLSSSQSIYSQWQIGMNAGVSFTGFGDGTGSNIDITGSRHIYKKLSIYSILSLSRYGDGRRGDFSALNNSTNTPIFINGGYGAVTTNFISIAERGDLSEILNYRNSGLKHYFGPQGINLYKSMKLGLNFNVLHRSKFNFDIGIGGGISESLRTYRTLTLLVNATDIMSTKPEEYYYVVYNISDKAVEPSFHLNLDFKYNLTDQLQILARFANQSSSVIQFDLGVGIIFKL